MSRKYFESVGQMYGSLGIVHLRPKHMSGLPEWAQNAFRCGQIRQVSPSLKRLLRERQGNSR